MPLVVHELPPNKACDVCRLLDGDSTPKVCAYCGLCDAWICCDDQPRWDRRLRAWLKRKLEPDYKGAPDYDKMVNH